MRIRELDAHLINKIAAGEVIERPASVVKELVENSLDAGSSQIEIAVEGGGIRHITVIDDGCGMDREDLLLAIRRHTTSKIRSEDDLHCIKTLGFRGEALASIVEVSRAVITSRDKTSREATRVEIEGGKVKSVRQSGRRRGTTVEVEELFFNTPARRKFLKTEKTELFHIIRVVKRFVLSHPRVHFRLTHNGKLVLDSPPARDLREVVAHLYDTELAKALLEVRSEGSSLRVWGLVSPAQRARADRGEQHIFVNGRFVRDTIIQYAISKAYEGVLKDKHPIVFLFIDLDPQMVDVNVHPQKLEVRFSNPTLVQTEVKRAVSNALLSQGAIPHLKRPRPTPAAQTQEERIKLRERRRVGARYEYEETRELDLRRELLERASPKPEETKPSQGPERILGQLHNTYLIVQTEEGIEFIDQHVAHERILFEKYLQELSEGKVRRQRLLIPLSLELPPDQAELLERYLGLLDERLGVGLERFGGGTFILRDWPESLAEGLTKEEALHTLERLLETLEHGDEVSLEELAKQMAAKSACGRAVVKNTPLSAEEMEHLLRELRRAKDPYRCPHGRPIIVKYPLSELERAFGRR